MNDYESIGFEVVMLLGGAALLVLLVGAIRAVVEIIPVTRARREAFRRGLPMLATGLAVLYAVVCVRVLFAARPGFAAVGTGVVLLGFGVLVYGPMRDVISGVVLEAGRVCQVGDHVRLDELHGRIIKMGLRVLVLETSEGEEAVIPYSRVARERLLRTSGVESVSPHVFRVRAPASLSLAETKSLIRKEALLVHWSAISRVPEVSVAAEGIEVTVYAVDGDRGPDIEAMVRRALSRVDPPAAPTQSLGTTGAGAQLKAR